VVGGEVAVGTKGPAEVCLFFLYVWVLTGHVALEGRDELPVGGNRFVLPGVVLLEEGEELLQVELAILAVEVQHESYWGQPEQLYLSCLAIELEVFDERVLGGYLVVELEVIDGPLPTVPPHPLEVVLVLVEDPLEIGQAFSLLQFSPPLPLHQHFLDHIFVIVAPHHHEFHFFGELSSFLTIFMGVAHLSRPFWTVLRGLLWLAD
jgi:hypothetical protein